MSLVDFTAAELLSQMQSGQAGAEETTRAYLDRIHQIDRQVGAFLCVDADGALEQARNVDRRRAAGEPLGTLAGLPVAVKDVLCARDQPTTCASRMLKNFRPPYDSFVVERLRNADAVLIGKVNMDEFAMGSSTENSALQLTRNPWDPACIPGGSSGGSAAAVAARLAPLAVGSDTGGSIRQPAALCGVVGLKPTYGRVSRFGLVAFASSLDQVGPLAQTASDAALLLDVLAGHDPRDATSVDRPAPRYSQDLDAPLAGLRIGVIREHFGEGLDAEVESAVRAALTVYEQNGAQLRDVSLPHAKYAVATYYLVAPSEASSNLARYDGVHYGFRAEQFDDLIDMYSATREEGFGPEVKRRVMLGTYALSAGYYDAYYLKALKVRRLIRDDFTAAFEHADVLAGPTYPTAAFPIGEKTDDPLAMYLGDIYTTSANLAGLPAISVPCGFTQGGLPIGLQLHAPPFEESRLLRAAHTYQQHTDWHTRRPKLPGKPTNTEH